MRKGTFCFGHFMVTNENLAPFCPKRFLTLINVFFFLKENVISQISLARPQEYAVLVVGGTNSNFKVGQNKGLLKPMFWG